MPKLNDHQKRIAMRILDGLLAAYDHKGVQCAETGWVHQGRDPMGLIHIYPDGESDVPHIRSCLINAGIRHDALGEPGDEAYVVTVVDPAHVLDHRPNDTKTVVGVEYHVGKYETLEGYVQALAKEQRWEGREEIKLMLDEWNLNAYRSTKHCDVDSFCGVKSIVLVHETLNLMSQLESGKTLKHVAEACVDTINVWING